MMLTTDLAFLNDTIYTDLVKTYAANITQLDYDFAHAWYKLTTQVSLASDGNGFYKYKVVLLKLRLRLLMALP